MSEIRYYEDGEQATADTLNRPLEDLEKQSQYKSKAQFEKNAETNRNILGGSGFIEWGQHNWSSTKINEGLALSNEHPGLFFGTDAYTPKFNIFGTIFDMKSTNSNTYASLVKMPEAPSATLENNVASVSKDYKEAEIAIINDIANRVDTGVFYAQGRILSHTYTDGCTAFEIENDINTAPVEGYVSFDLSLIEGVRYKLTFDCDKSWPKVNTYISRVCGIYDSIPGEIGTHTIEFTYTKTDRRVLLYTGADGITTYSNMSVVQMEDEVTVAATRNITSGSNMYDFTKISSVSRQDFVFIESWHELIADKDFVYPYGNVQYAKPSNVSGLSGIINGTFTGADTYSLFGNWQTPGDLVGKGYVWSNLSNEDKLKFAGDEANNVYISKDGPVQVRFRVRVIQGIGNSWEYGTGNAKDKLYPRFYTKNSNNVIKPQGKGACTSKFSNK